MAISADKTYYTVEKGDNLWRIAKNYGNGLSYTQLAQMNGIPNPSLIYPGQIIKLSGVATTAGSKSGASKSNVIEITAFGPIADQENQLFATWTWWQESKTAKYKVLWTYSIDGRTYFEGTKTEITVDKDVPEVSRQSIYSIPSNAKYIKFKVKPISDTYTVETSTSSTSSKTANYFDAGWSSEKTWTDGTPLPDVPTPSISLDKYQVTATIDVKDAKVKQVQFQLWKDDRSYDNQRFEYVTATGTASCVFPIEAGHTYKVRCRAIEGHDLFGDFSDFSESITSIPATPSGITTIKAMSETSVYLEWSEAIGAKSYDIEYATEKRYFDGSSETTTVQEVKTTHYEVTGLASGDEYFFRVRAVNEKGESGWSEIQSIAIGKKPAAPTTWSSTTTCITGDPLTLYWVHNAEDGSSWTYSDLEIYIDGVKQILDPLKNEAAEEEDKYKTATYVIDTKEFVEGTTIQWRVRTAGITNTYGDWSVQRTIDIYAPPTLELRVTDVNNSMIENLRSFPFYIYALAGPKTQAPIGYHVSITANDTYETTDNVGNVKIVSSGDEIYSKHFDISSELLLEMTAGKIDLENSISYTVTVTVSMNSGLTTTATSQFSVAWTEIGYSPSASITYDSDMFITHIHPYCEKYDVVFYKVDENDGEYIMTDEKVEISEGIPVEVDGAWVYTTTNQMVCSGTTTEGIDIYYTTTEEASLLEGVTLSVYRREFDGSFTELATGIDNMKNTFVTDPHPSLDYARYRIVAITDSTGAVTYTDIPGYYIGEKAVIVQWDEEWSNFDVTEDAALVRPPWSGSLLQLPYNIDISDSHSGDVSLINYIGRKHPVSYYGTQLGETSSWNMAIPKDDKDALYALRRLATWMGDVYVREPSGSGYWASIKVSFSQTHLEVTIPVTLDITRVEGGI